MGMDVYGKKPTSETGEYFCRNVWGWRPLAEYLCRAHPALTKACTHWQTNDGDGLNSTGATALAAALEGDLADGAAQGYITRRDAALAALPPEPCRHCQASPATDCRACRGTGHTEPWARAYRLTAEDVREFAAFCAASGGFKIY